MNRGLTVVVKLRTTLHDSNLYSVGERFKVTTIIYDSAAVKGISYDLLLKV